VDHKDLDAWRQAVALALDIYSLTGSFPREEIYGLTSQVRRAAVSVASNISEGAGRNTKKEFLSFLGFSLGSLAELETHLIIAQRLGYCKNKEIVEQLSRVRALLLGLRNHLRKQL
jgi:four helix bundle protein